MKRFTVLAGLLLTLICSCNKNNDENNATNNPPNTVAPLLRKFIVLDPTLTAPADTIRVIEYAYDNLNRCITGIYTDHTNPYQASLSYYYNGTDTLMSHYIVNNPIPGNSLEEYFTYNSAGVITHDSLIEINSTGPHALVYDYALNGSLINMVLHNLSGPVLRADYHITNDISSGNRIAELDSLYHPDLVPGSYYYKSTSTIAINYDNHPNPFYKLCPHDPVALVYENYTRDIVPFNVTVVQKNNTISEQRVVDPTTTGLMPFNNAYTYTYNSDGYPATVTYTNNLSGEVFNGVYVY